MYNLTPSKVYILDRVMKDRLSITRMNRMLKAMKLDRNNPIMVSDVDIPKIIAENNWQQRIRQGQINEPEPGSIVFNTFRFDADDSEIDKMLNLCPSGTSKEIVKSLLGYCHSSSASHPCEEDQENDVVCWSANEFITIEGCPHRCVYCGAGQFINIMLNLEEFIERVVGPVLQDNPRQKCFRCNTTLSDTICFEPEYGLHELMTKKFAEFDDDRYLYIHTKSANIDFLADIEHKDRLISIWSINCNTVSRQIEPGTATAMERIKAAQKCQEMGISIRFKFKPIIPIRNWREEYAAIIKYMFEYTDPELVGFCVLMWMTSDELRRTFDLELFDSTCINAMDAAVNKFKTVDPGFTTGPFPHEMRAEMYKFLINEVRHWNKSIPVFLSTESREMWHELNDLIKVSPGRFACGCGPICVPGPQLQGHFTSTYATASL